MLRKQYPILKDGAIQFLDGLPKDVLAYRRGTEANQINVFLNFSSEEKEIKQSTQSPEIIYQKRVNIDGGKITLAPFGILITTQTKDK